MVYPCLGHNQLAVIQRWSAYTVYSGLLLGHNQLAVIQRWSAYTVEAVYIVVTLGTQPVGCYTEVVCLYSI